MNIRQASLSDLKKVSELASITYADAFASTFTDPAKLAERIQETRSEHYFEVAFQKDVILVAEENGDLIGYAEFGPVDLPLKGILEDDRELSRLYVLSGYQGKGIGKALLETALAYPDMTTAQNIYLDVWEKNEGAQRLYKSYGFVETGKVIEGDVIMVRKNLPY